MVTVIFAVLAAVCAVKWLCAYVGNAGLLLYMMRKGYDPPADEALAACITEAWMRTLHLK